MTRGEQVNLGAGEIVGLHQSFCVSVNMNKGIEIMRYYDYKGCPYNII